MDAGLIATVVTGGVGIAALCVARFKCLCHCTGCCQFESCKFGFLDNAIVDTHEVEFKKINANGNDLIYVSKMLLMLMMTMMITIQIHHLNLYQLMRIAETIHFKNKNRIINIVCYICFC